MGGNQLLAYSSRRDGEKGVIMLRVEDWNRQHRQEMKA